MEKENQEIWTELHNKGRYRPKYPSEDVVRFIMTNFKRDNNEKFLDLGCGAGRHIVLAANSGLIPYGIDFSASGVEYTKQVLKGAGFSVFSDNIMEGRIESLPYSDGYFDGILCYAALYYLQMQEIEKSINEMYRVLKTGGKAFVVVRNTEDYRYIDAVNDHDEEIEKGTFLLQHNDDASKSSNAEKNMTMHFFELEEVRDIFSDFSDIDINIVSETHENMSYKDSDFLIQVTK